MIIAGLMMLVVLSGSLAAGNGGKNPQNGYDDLWKSFTQSIQMELPESAAITLDSIEQKALKENNQTQLLKSWINRQQIFRFTVEDDPQQEYIRYLESKVGQSDVVHEALLHEEIAQTYANYLDNHGRLYYNPPIEGDLSKVEMKYWDSKSLRSRIDAHFAEALKPVGDLKKAETKDFMILFDNLPKNVEDYLEYEKTVYEYLFHRAAEYYQSRANRDCVEGGMNTDEWWLPAKDFVKVDLGDNISNPLIKCLEIYQDLIACHLESGNKNALIYNDFKRFEFINDILRENEPFMSSMDRLSKQYADNPLSAEIIALMVRNIVNQYTNNRKDTAYFDNLRKAKEMCDQVVAKYPGTKGGTKCFNIIKSIENREVALKFNKIQLPGDAIPAVLEYRNVTAVSYKIIKISEYEYDSIRKLIRKDIVKMLAAKKAIVKQIIEMPAESDYRTHSSVVALPALESGIYYLWGGAGREVPENPSLFLCFHVSGLSYIADYKGGNRMTITTLNRKTGQPEADVTAELIFERWNHKTKSYERFIIDTLKSDDNGNVVLDDKFKSTGFAINLRKGNDFLPSKESFSLLEEDEVKKTENYQIDLFTDRAIYRPGQTVYFYGIVTHHQGIVSQHHGDEMTLVRDYKETITLYDPNWQKICSAKFVTDEYGSFSGSFVIPDDRMNGVYRLRGNNCDKTIRVEEYKRPTFEVTFEMPKEQYKLNREITVRGDVKAYAGFGLDDVEYSYRVVRKTSFPWRCWWWNYPVVKDEQIAYGVSHTDEKGAFAVTFNLKPSLTIAPEKQPLFTYEIEITAINRQGETHIGRYSIRAGYNEIAISTDLPSEVEKSEMGKYHVIVSNLSGQPAKSRILRRIYRIDNGTKPNYFETMRFGVDLDRQLLGKEELERFFPAYDMYAETHRKLVCKDVFTLDDKAVFYKGKALKPGRYVVELKSLDDSLAAIAREFIVFDENSTKMPLTKMVWNHLDKSAASPGEEISFILGTSAENVEMWVQLVHGNEIRMEKKVRLSNEVRTFSYKVTEQDRGGLALKVAFVKENMLYNSTNVIDVPYDNYKLDVRLATVRNNLSPGAVETWELKVSDYKDKPLEAAFLAGMYDASLDVFSANHWTFSMDPWATRHTAFRIARQEFISSGYTDYWSYVEERPFNFKLPSNSYRVYRFDGFRIVDDGYEGETVTFSAISEDMDYSAVRANSKSSRNVTYKIESLGDWNERPDDATEGASQQPAEPTLRENFNETAFFFPQLRTNADGSATFSFTMPDALTRWKLMLLAYTKERQTGYKEYTFTSSKPVMIMADMPRYIYDNDTIWMVANVINTGEEAVTPKAKLEIFDAATMQPLNLLLSDAEIPMETILPGRSHEVSWKVAAKHDLGLIAFRFTAYAGTFSDAEQRLLPVLCSEVFMTQTLPFTVKANSEQTFNFDAIANPGRNERDHSLTLNFSSNPVWYAVQSLPYLANTKTDNAENAFYVFYANTLSSYIASKIPNLLNYIKKWQIETPEALQSQLEKDQDLKAIMLQETPWVLEAKSESEQRSRLAALFEANTLRNRQSNALKLISDKQQYSGGWSWLDGMPESPFISTNILAGFGRLQQMGALESLGQDERNRVQNICNKAVRYLEQQVAEEYRKMKKNSNGKDWAIGSLTLNELYALSFFAEQNSDKDFATAKKYWLGSLDKEWTSFNFNLRAKAALVLHRSGNAKTAQLIIRSFKECAQKNEQIGIYWPKKYCSFESHIATHANIMAAFAEIAPDNETMDRLRVWLLTQKQTNRWENSASTADALYALLLRGTDWFEEGKEVTLRFGNTPVSTEGGVAGTGFIQRRWNANEVTPEMRRLTVNNPTNHLVWGGLFRQYFVPIDEVRGDESGFTIRRELFVEKVTEQGKVLVPIGGTLRQAQGAALRQAQGANAVPEPVEGTASLKVGDNVTVKITFENKQDMSYVFVKDLRAAGFEPLEQVSRYRSNDRMWYYQTNTDTDMEFFIEHLSKGIHQLEYSMFVTKEGVLNNGYSLIQCQYAPEFTACSNGMKVKVERNEP